MRILPLGSLGALPVIIAGSALLLKYGLGEPEEAELQQEDTHFLTLKGFFGQGFWCMLIGTSISIWKEEAPQLKSLSCCGKLLAQMALLVVMVGFPFLLATIFPPNYEQDEIAIADARALHEKLRPCSLYSSQPCLSIDGHPIPEYNGGYFKHHNITWFHWGVVPGAFTNWPILKNKQGVYWYPIWERNHAEKPTQWRLGPLPRGISYVLDLRDRKLGEDYAYSSVAATGESLLPVGTKTWVCSGRTGAVVRSFECSLTVALQPAGKKGESHQKDSDWRGDKKQGHTKTKRQEEVDASASWKAQYGSGESSLEQFFVEKVLITNPRSVTNYMAALDDLGVESVEDLLHLTNDDVKAIGMKAIHERKFEQARTELRVGTKRALTHACFLGVP